MNFNEWNKKIKSEKFINFNKSFKENILNILISFLEKFGTTHYLSKVNNKILNESFSNIGSYRDIIIAFDIEFQSALVDNNKSVKRFKKDKSALDDYFASFIREFGALIFVKDTNNDWYFVGNILINFRDISDIFSRLNCKYIMGINSTVKSETLKKMQDNDKYFDIKNIFDLLLDDKNKIGETITKIKELIKINPIINSFVNKRKLNEIYSILESLNNLNNSNNVDISVIKEHVMKLKRIVKSVPHDIFGKYLKEQYKDIFLEQLNLYSQDELVKKRTLDKKSELEFLDIFNSLSKKSMFVVKGKRDMEAINNTEILLSNNYKIKFHSYYDIEIFNHFSKMKYGNGQLETTYKGLINTPIYKKNGQQFFGKIIEIIGEDAHNPVVDSLFTIIVASVINMGLNSFFMDDNVILNDDHYRDNIHNNKIIKEGYMNKYVKYKNKYIQLKNK